MGYSWIEGRSWRDVTRTERFFVSRLAAAIGQDEGPFVELVKREIGNASLRLESVEVSTDVHFFRDLKRYFKDFCGQCSPLGSHNKDQSEFDLVLFSQQTTVFVEAKAWSKYDPQ